MIWLRSALITIAAIVAVVSIFAFGRWTTTWWPLPIVSETHDHEAEKAAPEIVLWTCPMHPEIKLPEFGACPKCGMDLVKLKPDKTGPRQLAMSPQAVKLAGIVTVPVRREFVTMPVRMVGKVDYDETRVRTIAARVGGRLDRLYVDYTGIKVHKGDHLVWLYSPKLLEAQQELLEAKKRLAATSGEASVFLAESNRQGYQSAREKLLLWGLSEEQVKAVEERGTSEDHMLIQSPTEGVVIHKALMQGDYVKEGTAIYQIADLSHLWIRLDAFEQDLPWLRYGQGVSIQTEALPGEVFEGRISFIDPIVNERTRTVKIRVQISNPDDKLKPGMFVRAVVQSRIAAGGHVLDPKLAGKWISPMHPEVVKDGPGQCDVCGMDLVRAEDLGYVLETLTEKPLVVPATAVLVTGKRAVVYVELVGKEKPTYEGREVILGPRAGDKYIVRAGIEENDRVVIHGAFRIDSSMQILAKPSMMSMRGEMNTFTGSSTAVLRQSLEPVYSAYMDMQKALAADDGERAKQASKNLHTALSMLTPGALGNEARVRWEEEAAVLEQEAAAVLEASSIAELREHFGDLSSSILAIEKAFGHAGEGMRFEAFCPMAYDNKGASWLQMSEEIRNPYFGSSMLTCGEIRSELQGVRQTTKPATAGDTPSSTLQPAGQAETKAEDSHAGHQHATSKPMNDGSAGEPKKTSSQTEEPKTATDVPPKKVGQTVDLGSVYRDYFAVQAALAGDDGKAALRAFSALKVSVASVATDGMSKATQSSWTSLVTSLTKADQAPDIAATRARFLPVSNALLAVHDSLGHAGAGVFYRVHCPMAFGGKGGDWIQADKQVANPYYGASMLRCGSVTKELPGGIPARSSSKR